MKLTDKTVRPVDRLPLGRYLLMAGRRIGGNHTIGLSTGTRVLPNRFLDFGCVTFCWGDVLAGVVLPWCAHVKWPDWNHAADGSMPEMKSWAVGWRSDTPTNECPWDLYFWDGRWWAADGTTLTARPPTSWQPVPDKLLRIARLNQA